jgi:hypothetical protein
MAMAGILAQKVTRKREKRQATAMRWGYYANPLSNFERWIPAYAGMTVGGRDDGGRQG